jgi:chromosome segregation ATPase
VVVLGAAGAQAPGATPGPLLRDGERALRVELAALSLLQSPASAGGSGAGGSGPLGADERAELMERAARAENALSDQDERTNTLTKRLAHLESENSELRNHLAVAEANAALSEPAQNALRNAEQLRSDLELHKQWLADMQQSLSWRLTRPLRRGKRAVRP